MARARSGQLENWEVRLVKRLWLTKDYNKQQIHAFFTRPDRSINQARITEIIREEKHAGIQPSTQVELDQFLDSYDRGVSEFVDKSQVQDPLAQTSILNVLQLTDTEPLRLGIEESDTVEWKQSFSWNNRAEYARTIAGFANRRGGYLIFGIDPDTKRIIGIPPNELDRLDPADMSRYFDSYLQPSPRWLPIETNLQGHNVGIIFVHECDPRTKPLICLKQEGNRLRQGDIFYRYTGRTDRIGYPEMQQLLMERDSAIQQDWMNLVKRIEANGVGNTAILNTESGVVEGRGGSFLIDETLIEKLTFIREGAFTERKGAPTLKLIGELETFGEEQIRPVKRVPEQITWTSSIREFASQAQLDEPMAYIRALCHLQAGWVPVYYFIRQGNNSIDDAIRVLQSENPTRTSSQSFQIERLKRRRKPTNIPSRGSQISLRERIQAREEFDLSNPSEALGLLRAAATLRREEIDVEYLLPRLQKCNELYAIPSANGSFHSWIRTAACVIDYEIFGKLLYENYTILQEGR